MKPVAVCKSTGYHLVITKILKHPISKEISCIVTESRIIPGGYNKLVRELASRKIDDDEWMHVAFFECKGGWSDSRPLSSTEIEQLDISIRSEKRKTKDIKCKKILSSALKKVDSFKEAEHLKALGLPSDLEFIPVHSIFNDIDN